jgi:hypothetical protein
MQSGLHAQSCHRHRFFITFLMTRKPGPNSLLAPAHPCSNGRCLSQVDPGRDDEANTTASAATGRKRAVETRSSPRSALSGLQTKSNRAALSLLDLLEYETRLFLAAAWPGDTELGMPEGASFETLDTPTTTSHTAGSRRDGG